MIIRIFKCHCHLLKAPSVLKYLPPFDHVRAEFHNYFDMRMSVASACNFHENKLLLENDTGGTENEENQSMNNQEANCLDSARVFNFCQKIQLLRFCNNFIIS